MTVATETAMLCAGTPSEVLKVVAISVVVGLVGTPSAPPSVGVFVTSAVNVMVASPMTVLAELTLALSSAVRIAEVARGGDSALALPDGDDVNRSYDRRSELPLDAGGGGGGGGE